MNLRLSIILITFLCCSPNAYSVKPVTEQEWEKCREVAAASVDISQAGMGGVRLAIVEQCGDRPVLMTPTGPALLTSDCDWLYQQVLQECINQNNCDTNAADLLSMASIRGIDSLSKQVFNHENFINLCKKTCQTASRPTRAEFGKALCGGT